MKTETLDHNSRAMDYNWLVGRKVVQAEIAGVNEAPGIGIPGTEYTFRYWSGGPIETRYNEYADGRLVLDDGTVAYIKANEGCGGCSSGWYDLKHLAEIDNVITKVSLDTQRSGDMYFGETSYRIFVFTSLGEYNLMQVDGDDGNGYYGTGFEITVVFPDE